MRVAAYESTPHSYRLKQVMAKLRKTNPYHWFARWQLIADRAKATKKARA